MRYFCYNEPVFDDYGEVTGNVVVTLSEQEVVDTYWPWWYSEMCKKYGKEHVDATYSKEECIDDWIVINWAWESTDDEQAS